MELEHLDSLKCRKFMVYHNAVVIEEFFKRTRRFLYRLRFVSVYKPS